MGKKSSGHISAKEKDIELTGMQMVIRKCNGHLQVIFG